MKLGTGVKELPLIGDFYERGLKVLGIRTISDLVNHYPFRYEDYSKVEKIKNLTPGEKISVKGIVWQIKNIRTRSGKFITKATVADQTDKIEVIWFNQPFLTKNIRSGMQVSLSGKVEFEGKKPKLISPSYEIIRSRETLIFSPETTSTIHTGRLVPIYPETSGITSKWLRAKIAQILPLILKNQKDFMPSVILNRQKLGTLNEALIKIHFPKNYLQVKEARKRLSFDELFIIQLVSALRRKVWRENKKAASLKTDKEKIKEFIKNLPFALTKAQLKATDEILFDMQKETPSNRLLEGDVGSGKTVVAAIAAFVAFQSGFDTIFAAPTEILTFQHQKTLAEILSPYRITVGIWTASKKTKGDVTCGTHALLNTFQPNRPVGLVVVDEQHRFGVAQRAKLFIDQSKKFTPHLLTMTATPIPRTLTLTLYGDLDLSVLDEMPRNRQKISTFVVPNPKRNAAYKFIEKQIKTGRQAFIITPFVEPSESMVSVAAAKLEFEKLKKKFPKNINLGLLHGRLKSKEKETTINKFKDGKIDILVATPVVEVGIDVPNANVMMIESAERFGLAALHQLRGRVGRGSHKSYCLLFTNSRSETTLKRLKSMEKIDIGFELAEIDLKMRGSGEIFGLRQSGFQTLKIADLSDQKLIAVAQTEAKKLLVKGWQPKKYPNLARKIHEFQTEYIQPN